MDESNPILKSIVWDNVGYPGADFSFIPNLVLDTVKHSNYSSITMCGKLRKFWLYNLVRGTLDQSDHITLTLCLL